MELLNPAALYGFLALPLLLVPYLIRRKPQRVIFSSLLLFTDPGRQAKVKPWGRLRLPPIFFLQLLLLVLLILAFGEPVFSVRLSHIAIVVDNSASMQAREDGRSRIALAQEQARSIVADLGTAGRIDIYRTVPQLEKINGPKLSAGEAGALIADLEPYDMADAVADYNYLLNQLAVDQKYERVYLITDRPARGQSEAIRVITVGRPRDNMALTAFDVSPSSLANTRWEGRVEVTSYSAKDQRVRVAIRGGGAALVNREILVPAGRSATATFQGFAEHPYYEAEIDTTDALVLDNRRVAVPASTRALKVLGVSPRPQALASLRAIPGVSVEIVAPENYEKTDRAGYGLEIFHFATPAVLPTNASLLVLPPDNNPLVQLGAPAGRITASGWLESHPLNRYVNFALFRPAYARPLKPQIPGESIIQSPQGTIAFATERSNKRHLVLGFDPFPYLGRDNLPVSIFTLNFLDWFLAGTGARVQATGEPIVFAPTDAESSLTTPRGEKYSLESGAGSFADTRFQGIYQLNRSGNRQLFAVNYQASGESDLRERKPIDLQGSGTQAARGSTLFSFWPYLLMLSLLVIVLEWFFIPPARPGLARARAS